jgi:Spy/CpxP family protein refolding chaperone
MTRGSLKYLLAVSLVLNLSVVATAGYRHLSARGSWTSPFGTKMAGDRFLFEELSLTPQQMRTMREKAIPFRAEIDRQRAEILARRKELVGLLRSDAPDAAAVDAAIAAISGLQETMQRKITRQMLEQKALLEPGQQRKFLDLIENAMSQGGHPGCAPAGQE